MNRWSVFIALLLALSNGAWAECIQGDCVNGQGTYSYVDGAKYVGQFKDDKRHGQGTIYYKNGDKYVGQFKDDDANGQGTYSFLSGAQYVGKFQGGERHGQGTYSFLSGKKYVGEWQHGKRHGQGTITSPGGMKYVGQWLADKMHGQGTFYYKNGNISNDIYENGKSKGSTYVAVHEAWFTPGGSRLSVTSIYDSLAELEAILAQRTNPSIPTIGTIDAGPRTALIIGNSKYKSAPLDNPVHDATDMASTLRSLGFDVDLVTDASEKQMGKAISSFGRKLKLGGVGLFYYAGHGMQIDGTNYLIPIDANPEEEEDFEYDAIDAGSILSKMAIAGNDLNIVILDACRNNPFARSWRSNTRGLAQVDAPTGSIVIYATAPGRVVADGVGRNGIFTKHLLQAIQQPDVPLINAIRMTRLAVMKDTGNEQVPWVSEATTKEFYFAGQTR